MDYPEAEYSKTLDDLTKEYNAAFLDEIIKGLMPVADPPILGRWSKEALDFLSKTDNLHDLVKVIESKSILDYGLIE